MRGPDSRRLLLVAPQPFYEDRGTPIAVRHVLEALSELGYGVDVLTFAPGRSVDLPGVRYFRTPNPLRFRTVPVGLSFQKLFLDLLLMKLLRERLTRERYFCIHAVQEAAFPAVVLAHGHGVPVCYDMQSSLPEQLGLQFGLRSRPVQALCRRAERWLLHHSDLVMCMPALAAEMRASAPGARVREWSYPSLAEKMSARQQEVDALREELCIPSGAPVVVYSGTFEAYQGLPMLLDAVPSVAAAVPNTVFVIVGGTSKRDFDLDHRTGRGVLDGNLKILPRQSRDRIPLFLSLADVLACPRIHGNNLPLKILDYLAVGKPIVATDILAHRAVLDHDRALLVEPSSQGLAAGLVSALTDSSLATRLGTAAKTYCSETLSWRRFVGSIDEIYGELRRGYS